MSTGSEAHNQQDLVVDHDPAMAPTHSLSRSESDPSLKKEKGVVEQPATRDADYYDKIEALTEKYNEEADVGQMRRHAIYHRLRPFILAGLAALILGWWISATILEATRHRWSVFGNPHSILRILTLQQDCTNHLCLGFHPVRARLMSHFSPLTGCNS